MERSEDRRKLLLGYCTTFKFGRKLGLATINDIVSNFLEIFVHAAAVFKVLEKGFI